MRRLDHRWSGTSWRSRIWEHILILTEDVERTVDWYVDVPGLRVGDHPDFGVPVRWLYLGDGGAKLGHAAAGSLST